MSIRTHVFGTATLLGSTAYLINQSRNPTLLDSPQLPKSKLSAYTHKESPVYLVPEEPTRLQGYISETRRHAIMAIEHADMAARAAVDKVVSAERAIERTVKSLAPQHERLIPGAIYVAVIGLSGSIVARNRALPIRFLTPLALFALSARLILPETYGKVGNLVYTWEAHLPPVRKAHDETRERIAAGLWKAGEVVEDAEHLLDGAVQGSKEAFEKTSGIKLPK